MDFNENDSGTYVTDGNNQKAFKLVRDDDGMLQAEVKLKTRDKNVPKYVYVEALQVVDQVTSAMSQQERLLAYAKLAEKLNKS